MKNLHKRNSTVSQDITNALLKLMKKQNFNEITIVDIVNEAKVGRVSFYRNFSSKEDIIKKYLDEITNNFMKESQIHSYRDDLKMFLTILFTHLKNNFDFANVLLKAHIIHFIEDEFDKMFSKNIVNYKTAYSSYFFSGGVYNVYYYWLSNGCIETPEEIANIVVSFFKKKGNSN